MVVDLSELRERLDAMRAARLESAIDLQDRVRQLEETLDQIAAILHEGVQPYGGDVDRSPIDSEAVYWAEYEL